MRPKALSGSRETQRDATPRRAASTATFSSLPPTLASRLVACSSRCAAGGENRIMASPNVTRSMRNANAKADPSRLQRARNARESEGSAVGKSAGRALVERQGPPGGHRIEDPLVERQLDRVAPVRVHDEDLLVAVPRAVEGDVLAVGRPDG